MTSETIRNPLTDQLLSPENAALIIIDYQPIQVSSIRSMPRDELVFNITRVAKAALNYNLPIVHSTVNVATGRTSRRFSHCRMCWGICRPTTALRSTAGKTSSSNKRSRPWADAN